MTIPNTKYQIRSSVGFTLVETMMAISILLIAVVAPMSAIAGSLAQIRIARDQIIAVNLAQEGIEAVRYKRDSNMLQQWNDRTSFPAFDHWRSGLINNSRHIVSAPSLILCAGACSATEKEVYQQGSTGMYYQSSGGMTSSGDTKTPFSRDVFMGNQAGGPSNIDMTITSTVTWMAQGVPKTITVTESLFGISAP